MKSRYKFLKSKSPNILLINVSVDDEGMAIAKLVYCDRSIRSNKVVVVSSLKEKLILTLPQELLNLQQEFSGVHEGLFEFHLRDSYHTI